MTLALILAGLAAMIAAVPTLLAVPAAFFCTCPADCNRTCFNPECPHRR